MRLRKAYGRMWFRKVRHTAIRDRLLNTFWNVQTGYFPVTTAAHEEQVFKDNLEKYPQFGTAIDQLHDSTPQSAGALLSVFQEARQVVETEIENMLNGKCTPEEAASKMAQQINKAIEEYNLLNE